MRAAQPPPRCDEYVCEACMLRRDARLQCGPARSPRAAVDQDSASDARQAPDLGECRRPVRGDPCDARPRLPSLPPAVARLAPAAHPVAAGGRRRRRPGGGHPARVQLVLRRRRGARRADRRGRLPQGAGGAGLSLAGQRMVGALPAAGPARDRQSARRHRRLRQHGAGAGRAWRGDLRRHRVQPHGQRGGHPQRPELSGRGGAGAVRRQSVAPRAAAAVRRSRGERLRRRRLRPGAMHRRLRRRVPGAALPHLRRQRRSRAAGPARQRRGGAAAARLPAGAQGAGRDRLPGRCGQAHDLRASEPGLRRRHPRRRARVRRGDHRRRRRHRRLRPVPGAIPAADRACGLRLPAVQHPAQRAAARRQPRRAGRSRRLRPGAARRAR